MVILVASGAQMCHYGVGIMAEATCEVAVVCYHDASIRINARGLCTCFSL